MKPYFIFSLPRSGSAWLSVFLTYGESFCYHEPLAEPKPLWELFDRPGVVGAVDTYAHRLRQIGAPYRCFVLRRDPDEIIASSARLGITYRIPPDFADVTADLPVIDYHRFGEIAYLAQVWRDVVGSVMHEARTMQLMRMNIQRDIEKFNALAPHLAAQKGG